MSTTESPQANAPTYCATHPRVETNLRCGKCDRPICPKCLVFTPVGARCRTCANVRRLPTYQVDSAHYFRAVAAAIGAAAIGGLIWAFVALTVPFLAMWLVLGQGYLAGEAISRATNRKQSGGLRVLAGAAVIAGYLVEGIVVVLLRFPILALGPDVILQIAVNQLAIVIGNLMLILVFALAIYIAVQRV